MVQDIADDDWLARPVPAALWRDLVAEKLLRADAPRPA
jgi:hypothetical protein